MKIPMRRFIPLQPPILHRREILQERFWLIRLTHNRYCHSALRSDHKNRKNRPGVTESAGIPEYVSIRQRRYGDFHGRNR